MRALPRFRQRALPDPGRPAAAARRHGAARRRGLGLCARRRPARRRHHPELRGDGHPHRGRARRSASRRRKRLHRAPTRSASPVAGNSSRVAAHGGPAAADREPRAAGVRVGGHEAADRSGHHLRRRPLLHQPVRQGRAGVRRRHRRLQFLRPARQPADRRGRVRERHGPDADARPPARAAPAGAASWTCRWTARPSSTGRRSKASISTPAGATAASRRRRPRAGASPTPSPRDEPHRAQRRLPPRPLRHRPPDRREGRAAPSRTCTEGEVHAHRLPLTAGRAAATSSPISATPPSRVPTPAASRCARQRWHRLRLSCATTRRRRIASCGITSPAAGLAGRHARHAHARDPESRAARDARTGFVP